MILLLFARSSFLCAWKMFSFFFPLLLPGLCIHCLFSIVICLPVELQVGDSVKLSSVSFAVSSLGLVIQRMRVLLTVRWIRYNNFQVLLLRLRPKNI